MPNVPFIHDIASFEYCSRSNGYDMNFGGCAESSIGLCVASDEQRACHTAAYIRQSSLCRQQSRVWQQIRMSVAPSISTSVETIFRMICVLC